MRERKDLKLTLKAVTDEGTFDGYLSVYDVVDLGNDVVEKGAFTKTISEQKGIVPMLWSHDPAHPLGVLNLADNDLGLNVKGEFFMDASEKAREIHAMSKRYHEKGRPMGLSIGFDAIQKTRDKGIRYLKEIKLYEGSLTLFPMLPSAQITDIKALLDPGMKDFIAEWQRVQVYAARDQMMSALYYALDSIVYGYEEEMDGKTAEERVQMAADSIDQFRTAYLDHLPQLLAMWGVKVGTQSEEKAGRRISAATRLYIEEAIEKLSALLAGDDGTFAESTSEEAAASKDGAATEPREPEGFSLDAIHSWACDFTGAVKAHLSTT
ncbi:MAG: hypothetical protein A2Z18_11105 [Armatimonadetes bacterium RBG_16_58_9]|nr:MAG: hypothetical protein A2Z18_11105 [Armatimonadetes bacterium RBG_16_58_9]